MTVRALLPLILGVILLPPAASARNWLVSKTDPRGVKSLYDIDSFALKPGDTVIMRDGVYDEILSAVTGVRYLARGKVYIKEIRVESVSDVTVEGFRLDGGQKSGQTGITVVESRQITIRNCRIREFQEAVRASNSKYITLENLLLEDNERGVAIYLSDYVTIKNSLINHTPHGSFRTVSESPRDGSTENDDFGIEISGGNGIVVDHNTIVHNGAVGVIAMGDNGTQFTNNILAFNGWGVGIETPGTRTFSHNLFYKNRDGDQKPASMPGVPLPLSQGRFFSFNPGFVDAKKGDWRLRHKTRSAKSDKEGSYLGAFPPLPPPEAK